jgi:iron-sulfur cluster repair protein YtfE (RIC family)
MPTPTEKDACELLDADHIAVKHLFVEYARQAAALSRETAEERASLARRICEELTVHAQIEEEIFYPALRKAVPDAAPLLDEAEHEHGEVKQLVAEIQAMATADAVMDDLVAKLAAAVEHHVKEERDELFPKAKAAHQIDLMALGGQLKDRQQALQAAQPA